MGKSEIKELIDRSLTRELEFPSLFYEDYSLLEMSLLNHNIDISDDNMYIEIGERCLSSKIRAFKLYDYNSALSYLENLKSEVENVLLRNIRSNKNGVTVIEFFSWN